MSQHNTEFHSQDTEDFYEVQEQHHEIFDLEQVNQFQPEFEPRSTTTATTDIYASSQIESNRYRDQGDPNEYGPLFEDQ